jgi:hypothetical protein
MQHHYCPLALLHLHKQNWTVAKDLRRLFVHLSTLTERVEHMRRPEEIKTEIFEEVQVVERNVLYEECTSNDKLRFGELVSYVPGTNIQVTKANRENSKLVFGVVSGVSEDDGRKRYRVTIYGRARCKVVGEVEVGDLLTVAEEDGCATRSGSVREFLHAGSLVGKALDSYTPKSDDDPDTTIPQPETEEDEKIYGEIDIIVTLQ